MDQYAAHVLATTRSAEYAAEAALSRLAAATRQSSESPGRSHRRPPDLECLQARAASDAAVG
jgi:hypothetical protein